MSLAKNSTVVMVSSSVALAAMEMLSVLRKVAPVEGDVRATVGGWFGRLTLMVTGAEVVARLPLSIAFAVRVYEPAGRLVVVVNGAEESVVMRTPLIKNSTRKIASSSEAFAEMVMASVVRKLASLEGELITIVGG